MDLDLENNRHLLWGTDLTRAELATLLERDQRTLDAWARGRPIPKPTRTLLEILAGRMPWRGFEGFTVRRGYIYPPGLRDGFEPHQLAVLPLQLARLTVLERDLERLRAAPAQYLLDFGPGAH